MFEKKLLMTVIRLCVSADVELLWPEVVVQFPAPLCRDVRHKEKT